MAGEAVDIVLGDVFLVYEHMVTNPLQVILPIVTDATSLTRDLALSADQVSVAVRAIHTLLVCQVVIVGDTATEVEILLRNLVATGASTQSLIKMLVLKVAQKTGGGRHGHVGALDDLAVTTGAAQLLSAPLLFQVWPMVERHAVEIQLAGEQACFMAARS